MKEKSIAPLLFLIALLFLLALSVRVMGLRHHTLQWADPWLHYSVTKTNLVATHHHSPWNNLSNFPRTGKNWTPAGFYYILVLPFTVMSNKSDHLIYFFEVWPIIFGTIAVGLLYVLMKNAFNKRIAFLSGFFLAIVSAASIRSTSGIYRGDVFLIVTLLLAIYGYIKVYKSPLLKGMKWVAIEIVLLLASMLLFNGWILILLILLSFSFIVSIVAALKRKSTLKNVFIALSVSLPCIVYMYCFNALYSNLDPGFIYKISLVILGISGAIFYTDAAGRITRSKKWFAAALLLPLIAMGFLYQKATFLREILISRSAFFLPQSEVARQIMELQPVTPAAYLSAYTSLVLMVVFGGALLLFSVIKGKRAVFKPRSPGLLSLCMLGVWVLFSLYLSVTLNRFLFAAAPGICAFSGMSFYYFFYSAEKSISSDLVRLLAKYSVIFLYVLVPLFGSFYMYSSMEPYITPQWEEASYWLRNNSGEDASVLTDWDQGNWFQALAQRHTAVDTIMAQIPEKSAAFFCNSPQRGLTYVRYKRIQYVALDEHTVARYYMMAQFVDDPVPYETSMLCNLYFGNVDGLELVFESEGLKMFKVVYDTPLVTDFSFTTSNGLTITIFTFNPMEAPVDLEYSLTIQDMESDTFSSHNATLVAHPGVHKHYIFLDMPPLYRFFIILEEGQRAPLVRVVFLR